MELGAASAVPRPCELQRSRALYSGAGALSAALQRTHEGRIHAAARLLAVAGVLGVSALGIELTGARLGGVRDPLSTVIIGLHRGGHWCCNRARDMGART